MARSVPQTDWERITVLYEALGRIAPSPVVDLNRAVAVAMARGPEVGLRIVTGWLDLKVDVKEPVGVVPMDEEQ